MEGRVATVLLMLSLVAACCLSTAAADADNIRLPSQADEVMMAKAGAEKRPWKCCNRARCTKSISATCKDCREDESDPEGYVCHDMYHGSPGPVCSSATADDTADDTQESNTSVPAAEKRPWKCCDRTLCTKSAPPTCSCLDRLERCGGRCKRCGPSESDPSAGLICWDRYHGWPGPKCTKTDGGQ